MCHGVVYQCFFYFFGLVNMLHTNAYALTIMNNWLVGTNIMHLGYTIFHISISNKKGHVN